jgi:tetratricopeptide (TPR) repeat protein
MEVVMRGIHTERLGFSTVGLFLCAVTLFVMGGCSSAPKGPPEVRVQRRNAGIQLEAANREADRGNYEQALSLITEARRLAVSADDPSLIVRTGLSQGTIFAYMGQTAEAQAFFDAALAEAERTGDRELTAVSRVYIARSRLSSMIAEGNSGRVGEIRDQVRQELSLIKTDQTAIALGWTLIGLAEKALGRWNDAEKGIKNALDIHVKGKYLELAAYDWYLIASVRSVAGQYASALEALELSLGYDRQAENTYGLGPDWKAMGDVYTKMGNTADAENAYRRSAEIFRSIHREKEAAEVGGS